MYSQFDNQDVASLEIAAFYDSLARPNLAVVVFSDLILQRAVGLFFGRVA